MTKKIKVIDLIDDVNFMIVKFIDQIDPQLLEDWGAYICSCETIMTDENKQRIGSEIQYYEDDVFEHWERILKTVLTNQQQSA